MNVPRLVFWFEFASTYSWLSAARIDSHAASRGVEVTWRPFLLGPIFAAQGWTDSPFNLYPAKGRYMLRDMERRAAALGIGFRLPDPFPQNGLRAARTAIAALETERGPAFCRAIFEAEFARGEDISDPAVIRAALGDAGLPESLEARADAPEIKQALRAQTEDAQRLGLFGAPSFTTEDGELFWGDDRLEQAIDWALSDAGR